MQNPSDKKPTLELTPLVEITKTELQPIQDDSDYVSARGNLNNAIAVGTEALSQLADLAELTQDPRIYRVLNEFIANMVIASKTIMDIKQQSLSIRQQETDPNAPTEIHNNLNVNLSMSEALELIKKTVKQDEKQ